MPLFKDVALVLRRLDYSETSQVLAVFTREHGQQRLIAKGVKRSTKTRPSAGLDLLELGRLVYSRRLGGEDHLATMTEWRQEDAFLHLRGDLKRSYAAQYAAEVTAQLTEVHDPHPRLFDALVEFLRGLATHDPLLGLDQFLWQFLREIGLTPEMGRCMNCGRGVGATDPLFFSSREGGLVCRDCESALVEKRRIAARLARAFAGGLEIDATLARPAFELLDYHLTEVMARPPRLSGPLRSLLR